MQTVQERERQSAVLEVYEDYRPLMETLLDRIVEALADAGYEPSEPDLVIDEEYRWYVRVQENSADIGYIEAGISEQAVHEGGTDPGINFSIYIIGQSAVVKGQWAPYNYTDRCWVDARDAEAVRDRWELFASVEPEKIVAALK